MSSSHLGTATVVFATADVAEIPVQAFQTPISEIIDSRKGRIEHLSPEAHYTGDNT